MAGGGDTGNGGARDSDSDTDDDDESGNLPFTDVDTRIPVLAGVVMLVLGAALRRSRPAQRP